jgi:hypothetical protein
MIGNVEFISIDAQAIDGNSKKDLASEVWKFVQNVSTDAQSHPRVLLTHIPLYRPDQTPCGPHRGSSVIDQVICQLELYVTQRINTLFMV